MEVPAVAGEAAPGGRSQGDLGARPSSLARQPARVDGGVHPLIREFYEHTSRFRLSILPERRMKPGYELFKRLVAKPLGQAAIPPNIEEAQRADGQHDRHDHPRRRPRDRHPRLDPDGRGLGQADLRRDLHQRAACCPRVRFARRQVASSECVLPL
jgi:hypothetical protein